MLRAYAPVHAVLGKMADFAGWRSQPIGTVPDYADIDLPRIRSERPAFELHYPWMVDRMRAEAHVGRHHETDQDDAVAVGTTSERTP